MQGADLCGTTRHGRTRGRIQPLEDNLHPGAEKSRCVGFGCVGGMDGDFKIRANVYALSETEAIKGLKDAFMMITVAGLAIVECRCKEISAASEWMHLRKTDPFILFNRGSGAGT